MRSEIPPTEQTLFAMLDRIGKESEKAYNISNILFLSFLALGICIFSVKNFCLHLSLAHTKFG